MSKAITIFENNELGFTVRTIKEEEEIWFVAKDVAQALEYSEASNPARLFFTVPEIWKGMKRIHTPGGEQEMLCLTEQGLYFFLGRSDKKKALPYQMWVAGKVVPSIRKRGIYMTPAKAEELISNPDLIISLAQEVKNLRSTTEVLQNQLLENRPKVIFADAVDASKDSVLIGNLAKLLNQNGVEAGQNKLFAWLRENGYLCNCKGERWNTPTQLSMDKGLFEIKQRVINNPDGTTKITHTTKVTGKGQIYFVNGFLRGDFHL